LLHHADVTLAAICLLNGLIGHWARQSRSGGCGGK
jgi:hypothetical protein